MQLVFTQGVTWLNQHIYRSDLTAFFNGAGTHTHTLCAFVFVVSVTITQEAKNPRYQGEREREGSRPNIISLSSSSIATCLGQATWGRGECVPCRPLSQGSGSRTAKGAWWPVFIVENHCGMLPVCGSLTRYRLTSDSLSRPYQRPHQDARGRASLAAKKQDGLAIS
jgi:hypothetical protein